MTYTNVVNLRGNDVGEGSSISKVGVDASQTLAISGTDVVENNMSLVADLAVAARAVELAKGLDREAADRHGAGTIVLKDFVLLSEKVRFVRHENYRGHLQLRKHLLRQSWWYHHRLAL